MQAMSEANVIPKDVKRPLVWSPENSDPQKALVAPAISSPTGTHIVRRRSPSGLGAFFLSRRLGTLPSNSRHIHGCVSLAAVIKWQVPRSVSRDGLLSGGPVWKTRGPAGPQLATVRLRGR